MRKWLLLFLVWLIVTPLLLEIGLRVAKPLLPPALQLAAERAEQGTALDINRLQLMTMDIDHNFMMRPNIDDALYGPKQTVVFQVDTVQILDSRMGFRTDPVQQGDAIDIGVVGDSFSFCFTEYADCWVTRLQAATGKRIMNLAQGSTGSMSHWRFIETFGQAFRPPLVIWQWFGNDFNEDYQLALTRSETTSLGETVVPDYHADDAPVLRWLRSNSVAWVVLETALVGEDAYISDFERYHFTPAAEVAYAGLPLAVGQRYEQIAMNTADPRVAYGIPTTREALLNAQTTVEAWGGQFAVILIPTREEVYAAVTAPALGDETLAIYRGARSTMLDLCADLDLTCYDLLADLQAAAPAAAADGYLLYYPDDMHLNPTGNAVVAGLVERWLIAQGLLK